jgi:hypothetical protein
VSAAAGTCHPPGSPTPPVEQVLLALLRLRELQGERQHQHKKHMCELLENSKHRP